MSDTALSGFPELDAEYELLTELGRGGMAVVYLARDRQLGREVAIKVIHTGIVDAVGIERQLQEARTVAQLQHPNVVAIYAVKQLGAGGEQGVALVMQYIPGRSLDRAMREDGRFTPARAEAIIGDITAALAYAHARGVIHRDIKPANIFLNDETGLALISDFGIALSAESGRHVPNPDLLVGTPAYMSPEQIDDLPLDGRSDLFSLGLVGYEMLAGVRPWIDEPPSDVLFRQRFEPLLALQDVRSDVSPRLCAVIERAITKDRADRWPSAVAMLSALTDDEWVPEEQAPSEVIHASPSSLIDAPPVTPPSAANPTPVHTVVYRRGLTPHTAAAAIDPTGRPPEPRTGPMRERSSVEDLPPLWSRPNIDRRRPWLIAVPVVLIGAIVVALAVAGPGGVHLFSSSPAQVDSATQDSLARVARIAFAERAADSAAAAATQQAAQRATADSASRAHQLAVMRDSITRLDSMAKAATRRSAPGAGAGAAQQESSANAAHPQTRLLPGIATNSTPAPAGSNAGSRSPFSVVRPSAPAPTPPPTPAPSPITPPAAPTVAAGGTHTCAVGGNGNVSCWGGNDRGQLGTGGDANAPSPTVLGAGPFAMVSAGLSHTCGVLRSGAVECWGANDYGQLGDSTFNPHSLPQRVAAGGHTFRFVSVGMAHTCALTTSGDVYCWGRNNFGQLGDGSVNNERAPVRVASSAGFVALSVGWYHACALTAIGQAYCWGQNNDGELGDGSTVIRTTPVPVGGGDAFTFRAIAAGGSHTCALSTDGQAYCWGRDTYGQLGNGDVMNRATPTKVASGQPFVSLTAGGVHTCALTAVGQAYCWGRNSYGQLGDGGTIDHPVPVAVRGGQAFRSINASGSHTCGRSTSGVVFCWGYNSDGQLGDGSTLHHPDPMPVTGLQ